MRRWAARAAAQSRVSTWILSIFGSLILMMDVNFPVALISATRRRQRSLSMAQLVPFRARATFEAAPARNDAGRLRTWPGCASSATTQRSRELSQLGDYFRMSDHPAEAAKTRPCATIKD
jgi:hypothetical protein